MTLGKKTRKGQAPASPWKLRIYRIVVTIVLILGCFSPATVFAIEKVITVPAKAGGEGIQQALDRLPDGGQIVLEAGTYTVRQPIIMECDGQIMRGVGAATVLFLADNADCPVVILGSPSHKSGKPTTGLALSDLLIDGNRKHQRLELWRTLPDGLLYNNGINVWNVDGATVDRVVCCRCRSGGLVSTARTRRLTVTDFRAFDNQFDGLACYTTEESHFSGLNIHDNLAAGISLDLDFNHNVIEGAVLTDNDLGVFMRQSHDNTFKNLTITRSRHHGVFMAQTWDGSRLVPGTECTGNSFDKLLVTHCGGWAFLVNNDSCVGNTITGGQFLGNAKGGLSQAQTHPVTVRDLTVGDTRSVIGHAIGHATVVGVNSL
jgi:hypothetical protein